MVGSATDHVLLVYTTILVQDAKAITVRWQLCAISSIWESTACCSWSHNQSLVARHQEVLHSCRAPCLVGCGVVQNCGLSKALPRPPVAFLGLVGKACLEKHLWANLGGDVDADDHDVLVRFVCISDEMQNLYRYLCDADGVVSNRESSLGEVLEGRIKTEFVSRLQWLSRT